MPEYTDADVIIDPNDPRVEIGKDYYFADYPFEVIAKAQRDEKAKKLIHVNDQECFGYQPFFIENSVFACACLVRKKEPSYAERQEKWIKENDLKVGDLVRVTREAEDYEEGWGASWTIVMSNLVGSVLKVKKIDEECGIDLPAENEDWFFPYFVLEKVGPKYVPFDLSDKKVRDELRGKWITPKGHSYSIEKQITLFGSQMTEYGKIWCVDMDITPDKLLAFWTFLDGTPCGKLVEIEE